MYGKEWKVNPSRDSRLLQQYFICFTVHILQNNDFARDSSRQMSNSLFLPYKWIEIQENTREFNYFMLMNSLMDFSFNYVIENNVNSQASSFLQFGTLCNVFQLTTSVSSYIFLSNTGCFTIDCANF